MLYSSISLNLGPDQIDPLLGEWPGHVDRREWFGRLITNCRHDLAFVALSDKFFSVGFHGCLEVSLP